MIPKATHVALFLALAGTACSGTSGPEERSDALLPGQPVELTLRVGDDLRVADSILRLTFVRIAGDSRCPTDVTCVWEGNAAVELGVALGMGPTVPYTLNTSLDPQAVSVGEFTIALLDVTPYPKSTVVIDPDEYSIRVRVEI